MEGWEEQRPRPKPFGKQPDWTSEHVTLGRPILEGLDKRGGLCPFMPICSSLEEDEEERLAAGDERAGGSGAEASRAGPG